MSYFLRNIKAITFLFFVIAISSANSRVYGAVITPHGSSYANGRLTLTFLIDNNSYPGTPTPVDMYSVTLATCSYGGLTPSSPSLPFTIGDIKAGTSKTFSVTFN